MNAETNKIMLKRVTQEQLLEILVIAALSILVFFYASKHDVLESLVNFAQRHEKWELDEFITVAIFLVFAMSYFSLHRWHEVSASYVLLARQHKELEMAFSEIKYLSGLLPICTECKRIRDDAGYWHRVEMYIQEHTDAEFTHGICPDCIQKLYPEIV